MVRILSEKDFGPTGFRWLTMKRITWVDPHGHVRFWESAERTTRRGEVDGVAIVAAVTRAGLPPATLIVSQFRPPLGCVCLELPAGLVDAGESAAEAAVRELREETGFVATQVLAVTPVCCSDPGLTNANMRLVTLHVDADDPENVRPKPQLEDGEYVEVHLAPAGPQLLRWLLDTQQQRGWAMDARLLAYACGLAAAGEAAAGPPSKPLGVSPSGAAEAAAPQPLAADVLDPEPREAAPPLAPRRPLQRALTSLDGWGARLLPEALADLGFIAGVAVGGGLAAVVALTLARQGGP